MLNLGRKGATSTRVNTVLCVAFCFQSEKYAFKHQKLFLLFLPNHHSGMLFRIARRRNRFPHFVEKQRTFTYKSCTTQHLVKLTKASREFCLKIVAYSPKVTLQDARRLHFSQQIADVSFTNCSAVSKGDNIQFHQWNTNATTVETNSSQSQRQSRLCLDFRRSLKGAVGGHGKSHVQDHACLSRFHLFSAVQ